MSLPKLHSQYANTFPELVADAVPAPSPEPNLVVLNEPYALELGLDPQWLATDQGINFLLGHNLPADAKPVAQAYAGHQFGNYVPLLGDGRAMLTGELSVNNQLVDIHLKGSGPTKYSRPGSDGFAGLGPMLREYLISEAVHRLGMPTTRALAVITTGTNILRDTSQPAAVLVRTGPSHIRVGTFQYVRTKNQLELLQRLTAYSLQRHYPAVDDAGNPGLTLLQQVVRAQAELVAGWMHAGLVHGVMNTDNMTVAGHSIDFGPVAFLDQLNPAAVFSSIDFGGRYAFGNQPIIAEWNLARFAEALLPAIMQPDAQQVMSQDEAVEVATSTVTQFRSTYSSTWSLMLNRRLGLDDAADSRQLGKDLYERLRASGNDFTSFFASLAPTAASGLVPLNVTQDLTRWFETWLALSPDVELVAAHNPLYVPRNHLVEEALQDAVTAQDLTAFHTLFDAVTNPFERRAGLEHLEQPASMAFAQNYQTFCGT